MPTPVGHPLSLDSAGTHRMLTSKDRISWCVLVCVCGGVGRGEALAEYFPHSLFLSAEALGNRVIDFLLRSGAWSGKALLG